MRVANMHVKKTRASVGGPGGAEPCNEGIRGETSGSAICLCVRRKELPIPQALSNMHWRPQALLSGGVRRRASLNTRCTQYSVATRGRSIGASASQAAAETSAAGANPYPFPEKPRPTPHEIFHLSPSATAKDIKLRCTLSMGIHMQSLLASLTSCWELRRLRAGEDISSRRSSPCVSARYQPETLEYY